MNVGKILEITFTLIVIYLVVQNAMGASSLIKSSGAVYVDAVKALQGRD